VKPLVEMMELQRVQCFPACPTNPDTSVFAEFFPASQPAPSQPKATSEEEKQMHVYWNPLVFLLDFSAQRILTRFPPDVWQAFFCRSFRVPIPKMLAHAQGCTLCSCKICIDPLGDHDLIRKQHTGSIRGHNHLMLCQQHINCVVKGLIQQTAFNHTTSSKVVYKLLRTICLLDAMMHLQKG